MDADGVDIAPTITEDLTACSASRARISSRWRRWWYRCQPTHHDQIVAVTLPGGRQGGQLPGALGRCGTARAVAAELAGADRARRERGQDAGLALAAAQAAPASGAPEGFGGEVGQRPVRGALQGSCDAVRRPAGGVGVRAERD